MGLDISVYTKLKMKEEDINDDMVFEYGRSEYEFRAGSYSGYNAWRNQLAVLAGYESAEFVWEHVKEGPFYEIINFSDCEGVIATKISKKLHQDFMDFAKAAAKHDDSYFKDLYLDWMHAFSLSSDDGCVQFH